MSHVRNILVIRLSALGDIIRSLPTMAAIRAHYPQARITFLTLAPFARLLDNCPYVDEIWGIEAWSWKKPRSWIAFAVELRRRCFDCVYDIQRNDRTWILSLLAPSRLRKRWYDRKRGGFSYPPGDLVASDIWIFPPVDLDWMTGDTSGFSIPRPFVLLVPGSAVQHPGKRWPAERYADLCGRLSAAGYTPVLIGSAAERDVLDRISASAPRAVNLCGRTTLGQIAELARQAAGAVGNDTGPMHIISAVGCPLVSLFATTVSQPERSAPRGKVVKILQAPTLDTVGTEAVFEVLSGVVRAKG